jgi:hypothetical protein
MKSWPQSTLRWEICRNSSGMTLPGLHSRWQRCKKMEAGMGGSLSAGNVDIAYLFASRGQLEKALDSYGRFVTTRFLP